MTAVPGHGAEASAARVERRWGSISVVIIALLMVMAAYAGIHRAVMPQARVETADPRTLHIAGEWTITVTDAAGAKLHESKLTVK